MSRMYSVTFDAVAVTAAQDFFEITAAAGKAYKLHSIFIGQSSDAGDAEDEMLKVKINRNTSGSSSGSGGSAATARPLDVSDSAAGTSCEVNNTTPVSGGTQVLLHQDTFNVRAGWCYRPTPEERITWAGSERLTVNLPTAPADSLTMSGTLYLEELG